MASLIRRLASRSKSDRGAELIEFAIVFPIFLLMFAAMIDFGFLFQRYEVVTNAAREGARVAILPDYTVTDVQNRVRDYLTVSGLTAVITPPTVVYTNQTLPSGKIVRIVTVTVVYPSQFFLMQPFAGLIGGAAPGTVTLRGVSVMRVEA